MYEMYSSLGATNNDFIAPYTIIQVVGSHAYLLNINKFTANRTTMFLQPFPID
jgi:hypothetical protein